MSDGCCQISQFIKNFRLFSDIFFFFFSSEYSSFWNLVIYTRLFIFIFKTCCRKQPQNMEPRGSSVSRRIKSSTVLYLKSGGFLSASPDVEVVGCARSESVWSRNQEKGDFSGALGVFFILMICGVEQGESVGLVLPFSLSFAASARRS